MERFGTLECRPERTHDGHLEAIENPCDTQSHDDKNVEAAPGQSVEPEWDIGVNDRGRRTSPHFKPSCSARELRRGSNIVPVAQVRPDDNQSSHFVQVEQRPESASSVTGVGQTVSHDVTAEF
jgi:hypothetical protein